MAEIMNRLYILQMGSREIRGLISPAELPDVVLLFYRYAEQCGAATCYQAGGVFLAEKGGAIVKLTIGAYHRAIPSKMLCDVLEEVMSQAFEEVGSKTEK